MWIQLILLAAIVGVALTLNRSTADARHQAIRRILLMLFVAGAAASVLFPQILTRIANLIGVGRGADLLLYALVIAFLSFMATSFRRMNQLQSRITVLARALTLAQARAEDAEARNRAAQDPATAVDDEEGPAGTVR
jgi:hypothetical protein